jgi:hypothetical protein
MKKTNWKINHNRIAPSKFYYIYRHWLFDDKPDLTENLLISITDYKKLIEQECSPIINPYETRL